jgi:hypothetical protein
MVASGIDVVRADGGLVHIRRAHDTDREALLALNARASDISIYYRFFALSRHMADAYVDRLLRPPDSDHQALVALVAGSWSAWPHSSGSAVPRPRSHC